MQLVAAGRHVRHVCRHIAGRSSKRMPGSGPLASVSPLACIQHAITTLHQPYVPALCAWLFSLQLRTLEGQLEEARAERTTAYSGQPAACALLSIGLWIGSGSSLRAMPPATCACLLHHPAALLLYLRPPTLPHLAPSLLQARFPASLRPWRPSTLMHSPTVSTCSAMRATVVSVHCWCWCCTACACVRPHTMHVPPRSLTPCMPVAGGAAACSRHPRPGGCGCGASAGSGSSAGKQGHPG